MKRTFSLLAVLSALLLTVTALPGTAQPRTKFKANQTILLYPEGQNVDRGLSEAQGPMVSTEATGPENLKPNGNLYNITDSARIELYFPKKCTGKMVIVCPGGGYAFVSSYNEGVYTAEWLCQQGIAACVVLYRMPNGHWQAPLQDVQNAFRYCRAHAKEWKVEQIGVMGFSAGGHLAASASTLYVDEITRPDFSVLIYPVISLYVSTHGGTYKNLLGPKETWDDHSLTVDEHAQRMALFDSLTVRYSLEKQVTKNTPPTFLALSEDDKTVPIINSITYYQSLAEAKVPAELHIYPAGGHGWGFTKQAYAEEGKKDRFAAFRPMFEKSLRDWLDRL